MPGFAGMFLRHHRRFGVLGLAGYLLLSIGYLAMLANQCIVAYVLPTVANSDPGLRPEPTSTPPWVARPAVTSARARAVPRLRDRAIGRGLLFGIALFRAACWPGGPALLAYGTTSALALRCCRSRSAARSRCPPLSRSSASVGLALAQPGRRPRRSSRRPRYGSRQPVTR